MFEGGELSATKYTLKRVGFNETMAFYLLGALKQLPPSSMGPPGIDARDLEEEE